MFVFISLLVKRRPKRSLHSRCLVVSIFPKLWHLASVYAAGAVLPAPGLVSDSAEKVKITVHDARDALPAQLCVVATREILAGLV